MHNYIPKISVGMPVYNGEPYLELSIKATLDQTFDDFELIISDNASTDRTEEICRDYLNMDSRIKYIRNIKNIGAAGNYNQLFKKSSGKYFRWFNADDLCSRNLHARCIAALEDNPDAVMSYGKTKIIDNDGNFVEDYDDNLNLQQESVIDRFCTYLEVVGLTNAIYGLMRKSALGNTALMGNASYPAADTNLMGELTLYGKFIEIPETLFYRRMHQKASSWDRSNDSAQENFWSSSDRKFIMPTMKKYFAYINAIKNSPRNKKEKIILTKLIFKHIIWSRNEIFKETFQMIIK